MPWCKGYEGHPSLSEGRSSLCASLCAEYGRMTSRYLPYKVGRTFRTEYLAHMRLKLVVAFLSGRRSILAVTLMQLNTLGFFSFSSSATAFTFASFCLSSPCCQHHNTF